MLSSSKAVLDTALNQSGIRVSPEIVEDVLMKRFKNAACSSSEGGEGEAVYTSNAMQKYDVPQYLAALNGLPSALCKSNNVRKAQEIINSMKDWYITNSKTYNMPLEEPCRLIQKLLPMLVQRSGVKEVLILLGIIGKDQ
ncbi:pentatricopeptide repeat-containing protein [Citrus sinensis]|nr:pentatricopeptide repeat-containing protein [Citrus sinensis]